MHIAALASGISLVLAAGILFWLIWSIKKGGVRENRKGLYFVIPLVALLFVDVFICITFITVLPAGPSGVGASDGQYIGKVVVQWKPAPKAKTYTVLRATRRDGTYDEITSNISETSFIDTSVRPGKYYYKVVASNNMGTSLQSVVDRGHPAITDFEFFSLYRLTEQGGVRKLKKVGGLGHETEQGAVSGCIRYDAIFDGRAHVASRYSDYCDFDSDHGNHMVLNGTLLTETDMLGNGTVQGRVDVTGHYCGYVRYNLAVAHKKKSGGYYMVMQSGCKKETRIAWNYQ